jgi:putative transposase
MRRLLTGYAGAFNRRHQRVGHLFQNRDTSVVVEEEPYLLELVRYLHLNPLRAQVVPDLRQLDRYPWTGHSALVGDGPPSLAGDPDGPRPLWPPPPGSPGVAAPTSTGAASGAVSGAGRWSSVSGGAGRPTGAMSGSWAPARSSTRSGARWRRPRPPGPRRALEPLVGRVCRQVGLPREAVGGEGRRIAVQQARAGLAYLWVEVLGHLGRPLAPVLGVQPAAIPKAARRGATQAPVWRRLLAETQ